MGNVRRSRAGKFLLTAAVFRAATNIQRHRAKVERTKIKNQKTGISSLTERLRARNKEFYGSLWLGMREELIRTVGWTYIVNYGPLGVKARWFLTKKGCERALRRDIRMGLVEPEVIMRLTDVASGNTAHMYCHYEV